MELFGELIYICGSVLVGLWLADFATGCFHWVVDNYCNPEWPVIGPSYISPSHLHHDEGMYEFELSTIVAHLYICNTVVVVGLIFWLMGLMTLVIASACVFGFLTNVIHRWSHTRPEDNTIIVKAFQRVGLFQSSQHHTFHHSGNSDSHYCLLTDHVNPLLETLGLWRHLDRFLLRLGIRKFWWETTETA